MRNLPWYRRLQYRNEPGSPAWKAARERMIKQAAERVTERMRQEREERVAEVEL